MVVCPCVKNGRVSITTDLIRPTHESANQEGCKNGARRRRFAASMRLSARAKYFLRECVRENVNSLRAYSYATHAVNMNLDGLNQVVTGGQSQPIDYSARTKEKKSAEIKT